jgi:hypothetical protein
MRNLRLVATLLTFVAPMASGQKAAPGEERKPIVTTVCKILADPAGYNNRIVKLRAIVRVGFEHSILTSEGCSDAIWFAFADNSMPPGVLAMIAGRNPPGSVDANGTHQPPIPIHLIRDSNYLRLIHYLEVSAKAESCTEGPPPLESPPDCRTYRITATFTGRIDGVSREIHKAHQKRTSSDQADGQGFGHMGMFDAQLVVQSVENVIAIDTSESKHADLR